MVHTTTHRGGRVWRAVLAAGLLLLSLLIVQATTTSTPAAAHDAYSNGCTLVPDSGSYFNFHAACDSHDYCYTFKYFGDSSQGRLACDQVFLSDMRSYCDSTYWWSWWRRGICRGTASTYYQGVRLFGGPFF